MLGSETKTQHILKGLNNSLQRNINYRFKLFGNETDIKKHLKKYKELRKSVDIINCLDFISMNDKPSDIIRTKSSSSMSLAIESVKLHESDAVLSFGNTGGSIDSKYAKTSGKWLSISVAWSVSHTPTTQICMINFAKSPRPTAV